MKKMIISLAIAFAATILNAATVNWQSGALYTAASKDGGWSTTMANAAGALITMNVYLVDSTTYNTVSALDQKGMYDWAADKTATYTAQNKSGTGSIIGAATATDTTLAGGTTYYAILTAEYTDAQYGDMYMAAANTVTTPASGSKSAANIFGGASTLAAGGVRDWQPVPEPTSGLLLLLGMAGLALKRKIA